MTWLFSRDDAKENLRLDVNQPGFMFMDYWLPSQPCRSEVDHFWSTSRATWRRTSGSAGLLHDILKYPPNDIKFDPPEGGVERYFYNDEKVEDHGFRCSSQRRFKNHDHNRMPSSCAATCS